MARKVKCLYCSKSGTNEIFHKEIIKGKNKYFCNRMEYEIYEKNEQKKREITIQRNDLITWIVTEYYNYQVGMVFPNILVKRLMPLFNFYPIGVIKETFINNNETISWAIKNKDFTEYSKTCYIMTIIEGNINDTYNDYLLQKQQSEKQSITTTNVDVELFEEVSAMTTTSKTSKNDISKFLD